MTDKVQKIKEWISKEQDGLIDAQGNFEYPEHEGAYHILCNLDTYINSLQEEPVSRTLTDIEAAMQEVEEKSRAFTEAHQGENTDTILAQMRGEEPVSEDLKKAASLYVADDALKPWQTMVKEGFKDGAKWQKVKTLSDVKKAVAGKAIQFSMDNVEAWGDDSNGKTIKLKGRVTFHVNNPESIIDALFAELENDN